jgi:uncharacterized protein
MACLASCAIIPRNVDAASVVVRKPVPVSTTLDRLRRLQALRPQRVHPDPEVAAPAPVVEPTPPIQASAAHLEEAVPGVVIENSGGRCYIRTQAYPLANLRGPCSFGALLERQPALFAQLHPNFGLHPELDFQRAIFLDTETTGLGGAGVYCFMVGIGTFEQVESTPANQSLLTNTLSPSDALRRRHPITQFVVRQFFMRNPGEEGALLLALAAILDEHEMSVTFNGRTFDLPLLRTRFHQNQRIYPELRGSARLLEADRPHLDLLHPARRLWRRRLQSCRLINLEQTILGLQRSEEDVPGHLIPHLYTEYMRTGNAQAMRRVFYHNHEDVLSMVGLAEQLGCALTGSVDSAADEILHREDWLALGICYEGLERWAEAEAAYRRALDALRDPQAKADTFRRLGQLFKRQGRWAEAVDLWQLWLTSVPGQDATPYIELAKCYEWQLNDLEQAEMWTAWALHNQRQLPAWQRPPGQVAELEHRLERLQRKQQATPKPARRGADDAQE